jgi:glycerate 2-kinase
MKRKILIATDSFKDCLSSELAGKALERGIKEVCPGAETTVFPVADGGEGTASCINFHRGGRWKRLDVSDPLLRPVFAEYLVLEKDNTAIIELARASGLEMLHSSERNALETSTLGTGQLIRDALDSGIGRIILTIGGSATVDGGTGIASALGFRFVDRHGRQIRPVTGGRLREIDRILSNDIHPRLRETKITIACDVDNFLNGEEGAARVYGPQKGADADAVRILEDGLKHLSALVLKETGFDANSHPGTGAAGGASLFLLAYGNGMLRSGFEIVSELTGFPGRVKKADLIISGEGRIDRQTAYGKAVSSVARNAAENNKPFLVAGGTIEGDREFLQQQLGARGLYSVRDLAASDTDSIENASDYLRKIGKLIGENIIPFL